MYSTATSNNKTITFKHFRWCALGVKAKFTTWEPHFGVFHQLAHWLRLHIGVRFPVWLHTYQRDAWNSVLVCTLVCKDYLTVGVVVRRKWFGLLGRGGLMPRGGVSAAVVVFSALKVFISWATRPRPAQVGALPNGPASSETALQDTSDATVSEKRERFRFR